MTIVRRVRKCF